jgi:ABC-type dipeptide/oligopeptide/nickel transport system ATPase component
MSFDLVGLSDEEWRRVPYILISHSVPVVAQMATRIAVMRAGQFVEFGPANLVLEHPEGAYATELLAAVPEIQRTGQL